MYSLGIVWHDDGVYGGVESFSCNVKNEGYGDQLVDGLLLFLACHEAWLCVALRCVGFAWVLKGSNRSFCYSFVSVRSNVDEVLVRVSLA
jgi:hypothetical protein